MTPNSQQAYTLQYGDKREKEGYQRDDRSGNKRESTISKDGIDSYFQVRCCNIFVVCKIKLMDSGQGFVFR